ncbi:MAG: hypothetical protein AB7D92_11880 [Sphaerochaeta sp.]
MSDIAKELEGMIGDLNELKKATWYTNGYLMHGNECDSSSRAGNRMYWVKVALDTQEVKKAVLAKAIELCEEAVSQEITEIQEVFKKGGIVKPPESGVIVVSETPETPKKKRGRPPKAKTEGTPKKKAGRPKKVVEISPLTVGEEKEVPPLKQAKIAEPSAQVKEKTPQVTAEVPVYHEPCKTCRKSRKNTDGEYPVCDTPAFDTGPSGIETCLLWWERR